MHEFAKNGDVDNAEKLLQRKAKDTKRVKDTGQIIKVDSQKKVTINVSTKNIDGDTPLHLAVQAEKVAMVKLLLQEEGCNPNVKNNDGNTPLHLAAQSDNLGLVSALCKHKGVDSTIANNKAKTPINLAATQKVKGELEKKALEGNKESGKTEDKSPSPDRPG